MKTINNKDLTIILVLKGRDAFTIRWFEHAKKFNLPYNVIVADGGSDTGLENELCMKGFHEHVSYEYVRYPYDENYKIYYKKVLSALMKVETPYVLLASNDDFYFFDALNESVSFLNDNTNYVSSRGEIWDFSVLPTLKFGIPLEESAIYGNLSNVSKLYEHPTVLGNCALERVVDFSSKSNSIWHDVIRTINLKETYIELIKSDINDFHLGDILISYILASQGKIHRGQELYMFHQCHSDMLALSVYFESPLDWIGESGWDSDFNKFLDVVALQISKIDQIEFYEAKFKFLKIYTDILIIKRIKDYYRLLPKDAKNNFNLPMFLRLKFRKYKTFYGLLKFIYSVFSSEKELNQIPRIFIPKIDAIESFLKNRY